MLATNGDVSVQNASGDVRNPFCCDRDEDNRDRRLCNAATQDEFLAESDPVRSPLFLDHFGCWQALVNPHPTSRFNREPVRIDFVSEGEQAIW